MWRTPLAAGSTALAYALALPPFEWHGLAWIALVPLLLIIDPARPARSFLRGAIVGFATAAAVTWWLAPAIAGFFAAGLLSGALATSAAYVTAVSSTFGLFAGGTALLSRGRQGPFGPVLVAAMWVVSELVRTRAFGDPWALLGYTQHTQIALIQVAIGTGVYGVSFLLALVSATIAMGIRTRTGGRPVLATALIVASVWIGGGGMIATAPHDDGKPVRVAVVQPNVEPAVTWTPSWADVQLFTHIRWSRSAAAGHPGLIVWPEHSVPHYLEDRPDVRRQLGQLANAVDADIVLGGPRQHDGRVFNAARLIRPRYGATDLYHKQRLVPFAEQRVFGDATADGSPSPTTFAAGDAPGLLRGHALYGVSICHEALFPEVVHGAVLDGAEVLVNIANDGWLDGGFGIASRQHAAMAVFRAVEARRYLVRAATTGVSSVVDPYGRVTAMRGPSEAGLVETTVVRRSGVTPYVALGDLFAFGCVAAIAIALRPRVAPAIVDPTVPLPATA